MGEQSSPIALANEAEPPVELTRIEEDWVMVLNEPASATVSPQFHTYMATSGQADAYFCQITWNYWGEPAFEPGGLQIQAWNNDTLLAERAFGSEQLSSTAETVTWTQAMETGTGTLKFAVVNGLSNTWGTFGGKYLTLSGLANVPDLNTYDPEESVKNSCVTFGSNRVQQLTLAEVRYYNGTELLFVDSAPRHVVSSGSE
jgi:hypothetical protein